MVAIGTPEEKRPALWLDPRVAANPASYTGQYLKQGAGAETERQGQARGGAGRGVSYGVRHQNSSKKSFSSVSSPILACSDFTSMAGCAAPLPSPGPKTSAAPPSSCAFHDVI